MTRDQVARRLAELRQLYVPETVEQARVRLARERPLVDEPLEVGAARRLGELRALCELTRYLQR
jgi:hypothetical protein